MEEYAGRILAHRYRLPLPPADYADYELVETRAFDTRSGQEVLVRQVPLPEVVDAELMDGPRPQTLPAGELPAVRRAIEAAQAAAAVPDHPRLDQVFDVFAEDGSLWIVSELVPARPLASLIADAPLSPYRAAEVASDVLTALRVLHAHGWTHRNITVRTVLVCEDGRVVLTGLAAGAAEEALCGYDPVPREAGAGASGGEVWGADASGGVAVGGGALGPGPGASGREPGGGAVVSGGEVWGVAPGGGALGPGPGPSGREPWAGGSGGVPGQGAGEPAGGYGDGAGGPGREGPGPDSPGEVPSPEEQARYAPLVAPGYDTGPRYTDHITPGRPEERPDLQAAARAGAIAAYRAGSRAAAARVTEQRKAEAEAAATGVPAPEPAPRPGGSNLPEGYSYPYGGPQSGATTSWHGATPRRHALPPAGGTPQADVTRPEPPAQATGPQPGAPGRPADPQVGAGYGLARHDDHPPSDPARPGPQPQPQPQPPQRAWPQADPARPGLPAQLALPQGYHQAETPAPEQSSPGDGSAPHGGPGAPGYGRTPSEGGAEPRGYGGTGRVPVQSAGSGGPQPRPQGHGGTAPVPARQRDHGPAQAASGAGGWASAQQGGQGPVQQAHGPAQAASAGLRPGYAQPHAVGGPRTGLDAERARQTRMAVVGAVTERWAPEQARSVSGPWQLAAPVGPATDLWALGALLFRAVQGHAPYPEDSAAELVELVCAEPPAFAEECGALRPVVESLLRQDPTERPDFEELRGWLRSLVRSAPEPESGAGVAMLPMAEPDPARLPVVRRRGELHGRHRNPSAPRTRGPRSLGRTLLLGILVLLAGGVAYAMLFMPRAADGGGTHDAAPTPPKQSGSPSQVPTGTPESKPAPQTTATASAPEATAPPGYTIQQDPEHFEIAVPEGWERRSVNDAGQVRYVSGQFVLTVVPGRDKVEGNPDPAAYQKDKEQELTPYRTSTWSSVGDVKTTKVGRQLRATGRYTWIDGTGRNVFARNFVVALAGSYHVVMVTGPEDEQGKVTEVFEKATASYKSGG
ncbi:protein kinase [Streptomyces sp. NPDC096339]|uniref:protein kinase n=1 Tax=Streptomyces sp. NPDC096339 TaxID=3366086 RepID=UPI003807CB6A